MSHRARWLLLLTFLWIAIETNNTAADADAVTYRLAFLSEQDTVCEPDQGPCNSVMDVVNVDGSDRHHLISGRFTPLYITSSPDGTQFVCVSHLNSPRNIFVGDMTSGKVAQITSWSDMDVEYTSWSPDGTTILFTAEPVHFTYFRTGLSEIYTIAADGSSLSRLTYNNADEFYPSWSTDGQQIAFTSDRDGGDEIYIMNADGMNQRRLGSKTSDPYSFPYIRSWSLDNQLVLVAWANTGRASVIEIATEREFPITNGIDTFAPVWSPDGQKFTFVSERDGNHEIYVMNTDGTKQQRLTVNEAEDFFPTWSPDSKFIAFMSDRDGTEELYVMDADGTNQTRLTYGGEIGTFMWIAGD